MFDIAQADDTQQDAIERAQHWLADPYAPQVFRIFGYAGTGKTTLAIFLTESVMGKVMFGAFTGKAAYVMQIKGCEGASTIHSMIYRTKEKSRLELEALKRRLKKRLEELIKNEEYDGISPMETIKDEITRRMLKKIEKLKEWLKQPFFVLDEESEVPFAELVVIDEVSMVDGRMGQDLLSFGTKVMVLGDPAQLPPVGGTGYFTDCDNPDVLLTNIHRQARDNPILQAATQVRQGKPPPRESIDGKYHFMSRGIRDPASLLEYDQILVGRNKTRHHLNARVRDLMGNSGSPYPVKGDKLVCLRNNHDKGLLNGAIYFVEKVEGIMDEKIHMDIIPEQGGEVEEVLVHEHNFIGGDLRDLSWNERKEAEEFDYGYALTVHKSQGSQWNNVLLYDESFCFREHKFRWLYTGVTRAAEQLTIVPT